MATYTIKIEQFEGPFDLILYFIKRDELDINDIPIAQITKDFLEYVRKMEELDIDLSSEFIVVAASLMRIKAKMLIPRKEIDEEGNEIDPRKELVQKLLEYQRFKSITPELSDKESYRMLLQKRGNVKSEMKKLADTELVDVELEALSLYKLMKAFEGALEKYQVDRKRHELQIVKNKYTIQNQQEFVLSVVQKKGKVFFDEVFVKLDNITQAIVTFLGILELVNEKKLKIVLGDNNNQFWLDSM